MSLLASPAVEPTLTLILTLIAFLISWLCAYYLFRTINLVKNTQKHLNNTDINVAWLSKIIMINNTLNMALLYSCQTKNNIDLCSILLDSCMSKSDILTAKEIENTLHSEINNAVEAMGGIEKKRSFLETKIKDAFTELSLKTKLSELDTTLGYAQVLLEETLSECNNTEKMKLDVLKVNQVLDKVLLKF